MRRFTAVFAWAIFVVCFGMAFQCSSVKPPACIGEDSDSLLIRWGDVDTAGFVRGLQLDARARLNEFTVADRSTFQKGAQVGHLEGPRYCDVLARVRKLFVQIQTLHAPGETARFVELSNPQRDLKLRAVWNPKFETYGSKEFRALFDDLQALRAEPD